MPVMLSKLTYYSRLAAMLVYVCPQLYTPWWWKHAKSWGAEVLSS